MPEPDPEVASLAASAKLVYKVLQYEGQMTSGQIADATLLAPRTVRRAVKELKDANAIKQSPYAMDARKSTYRLAGSRMSDAESIAED